MKVASWNIEGRLTRFANEDRRGSPEQILGEIRRLDSDVIFLPEAFDATKPFEPQLTEKIHDLGYLSIDIAYDDNGNRQYAATEDPYLQFLSKVPIESSEVIRLGDIRNAVVVHLTDPTTERVLRVVGVHLDDRNEKNRIRQVEDLIPLINGSSLPTIVMGDFNAMYKESTSARILRATPVKWTIERWPHTRSKDILSRLSEMAIGDTMSRILSETNLIDADVKMRPTTTPKMRGQEWMPSVRMVQVDHILLSRDVSAGNFAVAHDGGSDHRSISVDILID